MPTIHCAVACQIAEETYYDYLWQLLYITIGLSVLLILLLAWMVVSIAKGTKEPQGTFAGVVLVVVAGLLLWQVTVTFPDCTCVVKQLN